MENRFGWRSVVLVGVVLFALAASVTAAPCGVCSVRYKLGETLSFRVEEWKACCCCCHPTCAETQVMGWRITDACGNIVHSVVHDVPIAASLWQGSWPEVDSAAVAQAAAQAIASPTGSVYESWQKVKSAFEEYCCNAGVPILPGYYMLHVDTSVGMLSCCFRLYDPCSRCCWDRCCNCFPCEQSTIMTNCCWRTSLVFMTKQAPCYRSLLWQPCCLSCP